ncbi:MAG: oligosaccharide flippase family protein [Candidatus Levybacteria bacterium]|nr:oligosaccharide flippase family protein [Candidatus Levybacteria bacterium]
MKDKVISLAKHPLITGSSIVFLGTFGSNIVNYIFNLLMGRMLSVSDYGLLTSLNSLFILVGIFSVSFVSVITKFSAKYFSSNDNNGAVILLRHAGKFIVIFSSLLFLTLLLLTPQIGSFLHISNHLYIVLVLISIFFSLMFSLPLGFIQGRLQFSLYSAIALAQPLIRLIAAILFISIGFSVLGPIIGIALSTALPAIACFIYLGKKYRQVDKEKFDTKNFKKEFIHYTYTYFLAGIGLSLLSNTDIILVRHFFDSTIAGQYAALSLMGKAIFYFTSPISIVFFPIIAYKKERKERLLQTVLLAVGSVVISSGVLTFIYFAFPDLVLRVFFPKPNYAILSEYLGYYSLYILIFSVGALMNSYFLSIGKTKVYLITLIGALVQIVGILLFHKSLYEIIAGLSVASFIMLLLFLIYYYLYEKN